MLTLKLPLLGPVIGWTRVEDDRLRVRVWAQLDDYEGDTPIALLTSRWRADGSALVPGSVQLWAAQAWTPIDGGRRVPIFAIADVDWPRAPDDTVLRVLGVHQVHGHEDPARGETLPHGSALLRRRPAAAPQNQKRAKLSQLGLDEPILMAFGEDGELALPPRPAGRAGTAGNVGAAGAAGTSEWIPPPRRLDLGLLVADEAGVDIDALVSQAVARLARTLDEARATARLPMPPTRSRRRLRTRGLESCTARLAPHAAGAAQGGPVTLAIASCLHPGTPFDRERADRALVQLAGRLDGDDGASALLLCGDQIYADATAGMFDSIDRFEKFSARYADTWDRPGFRALASRLPLLMVADDHEMEDGWSAGRLIAPRRTPAQRQANRLAATRARQLFLAYQRLHGAGPADATPSHVPRAPGWGPATPGGVQCFAMDTRFERLVLRAYQNAPAQARLCSEAQLDALDAWLQAQVERERRGEQPPDAPKLIVSGSVFAPGLQQWTGHDAADADNWQRFAEARARVARSVVRSGLDQVIFVSGDYHCAAVAELRWLDADGRPTPRRSWSVVAPPLHAPFPFANQVPIGVLADELLRDVASAGAGGTPSARALARVRARSFGTRGYALLKLRPGRAPAVVLHDAYCDGAAPQLPELMLDDSLFEAAPADAALL